MHVVFQHAEHTTGFRITLGSIFPLWRETVLDLHSLPPFTWAIQNGLGLLHWGDIGFAELLRPAL